MEATQSIANPAGNDQRDANDTLQRVYDLDNGEGEASNEERHEQDGLQSGLISPQVQRRAGNGRAKRQAAPRGASLSRPACKIGCVDPLRWARSSKEAIGTPKLQLSGYAA